MTGAPYTVAASNQLVTTSTSAFNFSVTGATAQADSIVVAVGFNGTAGGIPNNISDSSGNQYVLVVSNSNVTPTNPPGWIFFCQYQVAPLTTSSTITVNTSGNPTSTYGLNLIARGVTGGCVLNTTNTPAWSSSATSGSPLGNSTGTLTNANCYVMGVICNGNGGGTPTTPSTGFSITNTQQPSGDQYLTLLEGQPTGVTAMTPGASISSAVWSVGTATFINPSSAGATAPSEEDVLATNIVSVGQGMATTNLW